MEILFVTGNKGKLDEIAQFLKNSGITLIHKHLDLVEPRSESLAEIAKEKAKDAQKTINVPFIVDDSGLFIDCLNGFPGTNSNWVFKKIGYPGILKLLEGKKERTAAFRCAVALAIPGKEIMIFEGEEHGIIANEEQGIKGFGYDPIFIPDGSTKTWGEAPDIKNIHSHRQQAIEKLIKWIKENPRAFSQEL
ncbi:MAG: RdgB/HAM1 family non-canonical purine NTP pyrophosphatase [Nanoarchaeota archaeon]|nr:RdgB/HAM1 family non-canonical purine NTP pyrophosphatase [Nanoarchaeota archaeon]MBU4299635.1 RdgB/HAM1 family non-canonical purine NTP pyrophosphatase [Nanoarchaeota archaeon]MBU4452625.1 RdgB/HAM1 family non-canonical purine NTP pyrophosphatase [Nanoarchaeota archaeon]MCG2723908.1 RdgB/HAM1 family non-canonical purine NTP pyrophosphatase [archaeon]